MTDAQGFALTVIVGASILTAVVTSWARLRSLTVKDRYWQALDRIAESMDAVGFDRRFVTRGYYVNLVALASLGAGFLCAGVAGLIAPGAALGLTVSVSAAFGFGVLSAIAAVVARTGRPTRWIPAPYRHVPEASAQ